jgi:hypothetical protein
LEALKPIKEIFKMRLRSALPVIAGFVSGLLGCASWNYMAKASEPKPNIITAQEFVLVDSAGRTKAKLEVDLSGQPGLVLQGSNATASLGIVDVKEKGEMAGLHLGYSSKGSAQPDEDTLNLTADSTGTTAFLNTGSVSTGNESWISMNSSPGKVTQMMTGHVAKVLLSDSNSSVDGLTLGTCTTHNTATGSSTTTAVGAMTIFDKSGSILWRAP